jgi:hypothetical protein
MRMHGCMRACCVHPAAWFTYDACIWEGSVRQASNGNCFDAANSSCMTLTSSAQLCAGVHASLCARLTNTHAAAAPALLQDYESARTLISYGLRVATKHALPPSADGSQAGATAGGGSEYATPRKQPPGAAGPLGTPGGLTGPLGPQSAAGGCTCVTVGLAGCLAQCVASLASVM